MVNGSLPARILTYTLLTLTSCAVFADVNTWTKPGDGNWLETNAWSLGRLPSVSDDVTISNSPVSITIDSSTAQEAPSALSVHNITIESGRTLFLNNPGDALFDAAALTLGGNFVQDGGSSRLGQVLLHGYGSLARTNATIVITNLTSIDGTSIQVGGTTRAGAMNYHAGTNIVENGIVHIDGALGCYADQGLPISFTQNGGTTEAGSFWMNNPAVSHRPIGYTLNGNGVFITGNTFVGPDTMFTSTSGSHVISNSLVIQGSARYYPPVPTFADYNCGGELRTRTLVLDQNDGSSRFSAAGEVHVSENISFVGDSDNKGSFSISGLVTCSNLLSGGTVVDIYQTSGAMIVSNLFSFTDLFPGYSGYKNTWALPRPALYSFTGGTLSARDIVLGAEWIIESSNASFRVSNPGTFKMGGLLHLIDGTEHLGRFILSSNAVIDLAGTSANLSFENSSAESWKSSARLVVSNWNGSVSGGGVDRLVFGNDNTGLTDTQLAQIRFVNPSGFTNGIYDAQKLSDGEVVPNAFVASAPPPPTAPPPPPGPSPEPPQTSAPVGGKIAGRENFEAIIRLFATSNALASATGNLHITARNREGTNVGQMQITTRDLNAGSYTVSATRKSDNSTIILGEMTLTGTNSSKHILVSKSRLTLPFELSAMDINTVAIGNDEGVLLVGDVLNATGKSLTTFGGRVRLASTNSAARGTATLNTVVHHGKLSGKFTMIVAGLTPNTTYQVFVNGTALNSVTSTKQGRVVLHTLPGTDLRMVSSVQLRDAEGNTVTEATF